MEHIVEPALLIQVLAKQRNEALDRIAMLEATVLNLEKQLNDGKKTVEVGA